MAVQVSNADTLVVVHCYSGDEQQVIDFLPVYLHHGSHVLVLSPEDAPVDIRHPMVTCRWAGERGWKGPHTVHRQIEHWKLAAEWPHKFFLMNDADSMCIEPHLPDYLFTDPNIFWSNEIGTHYLNYEPPYFFSREILQRLIAIAEDPSGPEVADAIGSILRNERGTLLRLVAAADHFRSLTPAERYALPRDQQEFAFEQLQAILENPHTLQAELEDNADRDGSPYPDWGSCNAIDGFYVAITLYAGLLHRSYPNGLHGISSEPVRREGKILLHGVKDVDTLRYLLQAYAEWQGSHPSLTIRELQGGFYEGTSVSLR